MNKEILWDNKIEEILMSYSCDQITEFIESLDHALKKNSSIFITDNIYDSESLWIWLSSRDVVELVDLKKELQKKFQKSTRIDLNETTKKLRNTGKNISKKVLVAGGNLDMFGFKTIDEYLDVLRKYLSMEKKSDFKKDIIECFPNLFFTDDVATSINGLNRGFDEIKEEIVLHLSKLDEFKKKYPEIISENNSSKRICDKFTEITRIECSPQANRNGVKNLKVKLYNDESKRYEDVVCELHTKFSNYNKNCTSQDRIYFSVGKSGIEGGRIIIKHIGAHI